MSILEGVPKTIHTLPVVMDVLDDSQSNSGDHGTASGAADETIIVEDAITGVFADLSDQDYVQAGSTDSFELSYTESSGNIVLVPTSDTSNPTITESNASPGLDIQYLFVSSAADQYASWKICGAGLDPKKLLIQDVMASGHYHVYSAVKAIDRDRDAKDEGSPCFVSAADTNGDHWIQLDLGREFEVQKVVIFPTQTDITNAVTGNDPDISSANVRVGSCRLDVDVTSNTDCGSVPAGITTEGAIEVDCGNSNTKKVYGRYVYITANVAMPICEVYVYGDDAHPASTISPRQCGMSRQKKGRLDVDVTSNTDCGSVPAGITTEGAIEVDCGNSNTKKVYGRYVYITANVAMPICEVYVYGDDVPIGEETRVSFSLGSSTTAKQSVAENAGSISLSVQRTGSGSTCTYVNYVTDTSIDDADFNDVPLPLEIMMDSDTYSLSIPITDDDVCEPTENFNVTLSSVDGGQLGGQCWMCVEITDDDSITYTLDLPSTTVSEDKGPLSVSVVRTGTGVMQEGTAALTFAGNTATSADYDSTAKDLNFLASPPTSRNTVTASVDIVDDNCYEESETFTVGISSVGPADCSFVGDPQTAQITITDNDSKFKWDVNSESDNIHDRVICEGDGPVEIDITRQGTVLSKTVDFSVDHITTNNDDFSISPSDGDVTFNAGSTSTQSVTVTVADDNEVEDDESFTLTLKDPLGSTCVNGNIDGPDTLNIQIKNNDAEYYWKVSELSVGESDGQVNDKVCLVRRGDICTTTPTTTTTVAISSSGVTAISGSDFSPVSQIVFNTEESEKCVPVNIISDSTEESTETFTLTIEPGQDNIIVGSPNVLTVSITDDDDDCVIGWSQSTYVTSEGSTASVVITKSGNVAAPVIVTPVVISNSVTSATLGLDYTVTQSFTIPASSSSYSLSLNIIDDSMPESTETFTLTLSSTSCGTNAQPITIIITDNDPTTQAPTTPPTDDGIGGGAIAAIVIAAIIALLAIIGAIVFAMCIFGGFRAAGAGAGAGAAAGASAAYGTQLAPLGYASGGAYYVGNGYPGNGYNPYPFNSYYGNNAFNGYP
ncbi:uncharacterized protein [Amphiura filiformis]|uniref:uncharacterized protein n=1 Tax=Amphiura filiformis TaxID=82378 RepID=UPI003B214AE4